MENSYLILSMCKQGYVEHWGKRWYKSSTSSGWLVSDNVIEQLDTQGKNLSNKQYSNLTNKQKNDDQNVLQKKTTKKSDITLQWIPELCPVTDRDRIQEVAWGPQLESPETSRISPRNSQAIPTESQEVHLGPNGGSPLGTSSRESYTTWIQASY